MELHRTLCRCTRDIRPDQVVRATADWRPHLGIGYINSAQPAVEVIGRVRRLRDLAPVSVTVECVKLVELWREEGRYCWREHAVIPLPANRLVR